MGRWLAEELGLSLSGAEAAGTAAEAWGGAEAGVVPTMVGSVPSRAAGSAWGATAR